MSKIILLCIVLMYLSNTNAIFSDGFLATFDYLNHLKNLLSGAEEEQVNVKTEMPKIQEDLHNDLDGSNIAGLNLDTHFEMHEIQDDLSLQKAILKVRLRAVKQFIQMRSDFLKFTEDNHWEINKVIEAAKRKDLDVAKNDRKVIEGALQNPSQFKDMILGQD